MLINLRNALMAGKRLPYDAEVEYLESTGAQWIDTGVNAKQSLKIRAVFETNSMTSYFAYGVRSGDSTITCATGTSVNSLGYARWGTSAYANATPRGLVDIAQDSSGVIVNGTSYSYQATQTVVEQSGYTMVLFAGRNSTTTVTANMVGKFYSCKIWDNGVLVRDFIPVRKSTVGYLYDRVSGKLFGNAGTGDFVLGPDVVPVEYIESHGTEYINTGIILNDTYGIDINFAPMETASGVSEHGIFGSSVSGSGIRHNVLQIHSSAGGIGLWMPSNTRICNYAITIGEYQHWQINLNDSDEVVIDNVLKAHTHPTTPAECQYPVYLFGRNVANTLKSGSCSKMRLATWMVCDGSGNFIQKGLPIRVGTEATSWEGAMMDVLTRRIYRNQGTGAFGYGNDLKYPIPAA